MRPDRVRDCWERGETAISGWLSIGNGYSAETVGMSGADCVTVDLQHGMTDAGMMTCAPNGVVPPVHPKAMPVILTERHEIDTWLTAEWRGARSLQRPLPDDRLVIVPHAETPPAQATLI